MPPLSRHLPKTPTTPFLRPHLTTHHPLPSFRPFSTPSPKMSPAQEYLIILPDMPEKLSSRMAIRPQHLSAAKANSSIVLGGATLDQHPQAEGEPLKINGSALIVTAGSREEALGIVKGDLYAKEGVWDLDKMQVFPFKSAIRTGL